MRYPTKCMLVLFSAMAPALAQAQAVLRVSCFDANEGASITINGVAKGECPMDLMLDPGKVVMRAHKSAGAEYEQLWEKSFELADGAVKRIEVELSSPQLTASAKRQREVAAAQKLQADAQADLKQAQAGDEAAIARVIARYEKGDGLKASPQQVLYWQKQQESLKIAKVLAAANAGSLEAMDEMAGRYAKGNGVPADPAQAQEWSERAAKLRTQQSREAKKAQLMAERERISFVEVTKEILTGANKAPQRNDLSCAPTLSTTAYLYIPVWLAIDAMSAPFKTTSLQKIDKELEQLALRPAAWGNPDSLLARVAQASAHD